MSLYIFKIYSHATTQKRSPHAPAHLLSQLKNLAEMLSHVTKQTITSRKKASQLMYKHYIHNSHNRKHRLPAHRLSQLNNLAEKLSHVTKQTITSRKKAYAQALHNTQKKSHRLPAHLQPVEELGAEKHRLGLVHTAHNGAPIGPRAVAVKLRNELISELACGGGRLSAVPDEQLGAGI